MNTLSWKKAYTVSGLIHVLFFFILALFFVHTAATQPPQMVMVELEGNGPRLAEYGFSPAPQ